MKTLLWNNLTGQEQLEALNRPALESSDQVSQIVRDVVSQVKQRGDLAVQEYTSKFDGVVLENFEVTDQEMEKAESLVSSESREAMLQAISNITRFHEAQRTTVTSVETMPGVLCRRESRPIERVGLYVPGGTAPLPSTVMMLAVPAALARCPVRVLCTPPNKEGVIDPHILMAAKLTGINKVYKIGGAQAVAAMAFGTETVPSVNKIFGPGNRWVTEAKLQVSLDPMGAMYDMPAGPSEVLVIADDSANPAFIAADLLSQAEHGVDSQSILVTTSEKLSEEVANEVVTQLESLPRKSIAAESLEKSRILVTDSLETAFKISNQYGPEHLIVQAQEAEQWSSKINNAGSVFLGPWSPESVGDYASGTNHVLPTYGYTKTTSGLSLESFMKQITFQTLTEKGIKNIGPTVEQLASIEGLDAHRNAVSVRLQSLKGEI